MEWKSKAEAAIALFACSMIAGTAGFAQSIWVESGSGTEFGVEYQQVVFKNDGGADNSGWAGFLIFSTMLSEKMKLYAEQPYVNASTSENTSLFSPDGSSSSESMLGNTMIGVTLNPGEDWFTDLGVRLPLAQEDKLLATVTGAVMDLDRFEAFVPNFATAHGRVNYRFADRSGFMLHLRAGPQLWYRTGDKGPRDDLMELFLKYSGQLGYRNQRVSILGGVVGQWLLTESEQSFDENSAHQVGLSASLFLGRFHPGLTFKVPLDKDFKDAVKYTFGAFLTVAL